MAEQLATAAKLSGNDKASTCDAIACTLRKSYLLIRSNSRRILSLFWRIRNTQKFLKPWLKWISPLSLPYLVQLLAPSGFPPWHLLIHLPDVQGSIAMRLVRLATRGPDASNGSLTEVTHSRGLAPVCRLLEDNSLFTPRFLSVAFDYAFFLARCA